MGEHECTRKHTHTHVHIHTRTHSPTRTLTHAPGHTHVPTLLAGLPAACLRPVSPASPHLQRERRVAGSGGGLWPAGGLAPAVRGAWSVGSSSPAPPFQPGRGVLGSQPPILCPTPTAPHVKFGSGRVRSPCPRPWATALCSRTPQAGPSTPWSSGLTNTVRASLLVGSGVPVLLLAVSQSLPITAGRQGRPPPCSHLRCRLSLSL